METPDLQNTQQDGPYTLDVGLQAMILASLEVQVAT